ncbi:MAG: class I SAM-dependent methyltransferase [Gemmatimonadales bacterium]
MAVETPETCPLCDGRDTTVVVAHVRDQEYGAPGDYRWVRCTDCALVRLDPFPSLDVLDAAYPPDYHAYVEPESGITRWMRSMAFGRLAAGLAKQLPPGGAILDVGCSTGELLAAVGERGDFRLVGVESKQSAADAARERGVDVHQGDLESADIAAGSIDLAIMQHVLEHVFDPIASLQILARTMKPGGVLRGELPNLRSWDASLFGRYWGGGHAPRHLWHFSPATLRRALEHCGFVDIELSPALHTGHWALSIQNALRRNRDDCSGLVSGRTWYYPLFLMITIPINLVQMPLLRTGVMRFRARRPT